MRKVSHGFMPWRKKIWRQSSRMTAEQKHHNDKSICNMYVCMYVCMYVYVCMHVDVMYACMYEGGERVSVDMVVIVVIVK